MSGGLGIELDGISIFDLHPPSEVVDSYYEVAKAMETRALVINQAKESATRRTIQTQGETVKIIARARAEAAEKIQLAQKDS